MNKELEALEVIKHTTDLDRPNELNGYKEELDLIETALKRLEGYENHTTFTMVYQINALWDENEELRKRLNEMYELQEKYYLDQRKLQALEIIKEKEVNVFIFLHSGDLETYNDMVEENRKLTQEEYNLLKEVLEDESKVE